MSNSDTLRHGKFKFRHHRVEHHKIPYLELGNTTIQDLKYHIMFKFKFGSRSRPGLRAAPSPKEARSLSSTVLRQQRQQWVAGTPKQARKPQAHFGPTIFLAKLSGDNLKNNLAMKMRVQTGNSRFDSEIVLGIVCMASKDCA